MKIDKQTCCNELEILFVIPDVHSKGVGYGAWRVLYHSYNGKLLAIDIYVLAGNLVGCEQLHGCALCYYCHTIVASDVVLAEGVPVDEPVCIYFPELLVGIYGIFLYSQNGDTYSAEVCADKLLSVYKKLEQLPEKLSKFGEMIEEQPNTQLPEDIINYIKELKNEK